MKPSTCLSSMESRMHFFHTFFSLFATFCSAILVDVFEISQNACSVCLRICVIKLFRIVLSKGVVAVSAKDHTK